MNRSATGTCLRGSNWLLAVLSAGLWIILAARASADPEAEFQQARQWLLNSPAQSIVILEPHLSEPNLLTPPQQLELLSILARAYILQSSLPQAIEVTHKLEVLAKSLRNRSYEGVAYREQGAIAAVQTRYDEAISLYQQALTLFPQATEPLNIALTYNLMAQSLRAQQKYISALSYVRKALALMREQGATAPMADAFNAMGVIFERLDNLEESLAAHSQALDIRRALNNRPGIADSLYNIGEIYRELHDFTSAELYLTESVELDQSLNNRSNQAYGLYKLADIQCALNKREQALDNGLQALALFTELDAKENIANVLVNLAKLELHSENYTEAMDYLDEATLVLPKNTAPDLKFKLQLYRAKIFMGLHALADAEAVLLRSKEQLQEVADSVDITTKLAVYRLLSELLAQQGRTEQALAVLRQHNSLQDEHINKTRAQSVANVKDSVDFFRREQQLELLARDHSLQTVKNAQRRFERNTVLIGFLVFFALVLALLGRYQIRRHNIILKQQVLERTGELVEKNIELERVCAQLQDVSQTDQLTGLSNRRFLLEHIEQECAKSIRDYLNWLQSKSAAPIQSDLIFYLVDLDHFKQVNDRYGHSSGDAVLAQMKAVLAKLFRETDYLIRWGGEEFLIVARFSQRNNAALLAERLRTLVQTTEFTAGEQVIKLTASIGFACFPFYTDRPGQYSWNQVVDVADICLYAAKYSGRNTWVGLTGVEGLEQVDTFKRLFSEPDQVVEEGWVNLFTSVAQPESLTWRIKHENDL